MGLIGNGLLLCDTHFYTYWGILLLYIWFIASLPPLWREFKASVLRSRPFTVGKQKGSMLKHQDSLLPLMNPSFLTWLHVTVCCDKTGQRLFGDPDLLGFLIAPMYLVWGFQGGV
jgi:hypothetical protein